MDFNHSNPFKSDYYLQDYIQMPSAMLSQIPQQPYEVVQEGAHQETLDPLKEHLNLFWEERYREVQDMTDRKKHSLPLARIKKVMKSDERVQMVSADAPLAFAKACEFFILELTTRAWLLTEDGDKRTLQRADIANAICKSPSFDFLHGIVPRQQQHVEDVRESCRVQRQRRSPLPHGPSNGYNGLNMPDVVNRPYSPANGYNGPSSSNVQNELNGFDVPNSFFVPSGANGFHEPNSSNVTNWPSFPMPSTNNEVQYRIMQAEQCQFNQNNVDVEGFNEEDMEAETANGMFWQ